MSEDGAPPFFEYVVGADRRLRDLVTAEEAAPLLRMAVLGGASEAHLSDDAGEPLWQDRSGSEAAGETSRRPIRVEGEPAGFATVRSNAGSGPLADALAAAFEALAAGNLKRMLTTETHTAVVNRSYADLLETNRRLSESELRYRTLASSLEVKVAERTAELERAWARLLHQEKLASVGQLAAGIAHEINNPMSFVSSNIGTLSRYVARFADLIAFQRDAIERVASETVREELRRRWESGRIGFMLDDIGPLFAQTLEGADRVRKIVSDLRGFSHIDDDGTPPADLNAEIDRTLSVIAHEIPADARIEKDYGALPGIRCRAADFCQIFLNIVRNAIQARPVGLALRIRTRSEGGRISIAFADNGPGFAPDVLPHAFEPFFTTRGIGQGTGLGLAVAHAVVSDHGGTIEAANAPGGGALLSLTLPDGRG